MLTAAYWHVLNIDPAAPTAEMRDRFILSKGHAAMAIYATLAHSGFFSRDLLDDLYRRRRQACRTSAGQPVARHRGRNRIARTRASDWLRACARGQDQDVRDSYRVFALLSDGECNEGSVWEAAMFAAAQDLKCLCVIVDYNKWQATARSNETLRLSPLREKWESFGWDAHEVDGHDIEALCEVLSSVPNRSGRPVAVVAHTVKGKGVSFMEDDNNWHYRAPTAEEVVLARKELGLS